MVRRRNNIKPANQNIQHEVDKILGHFVDSTQEEPTVEFNVSWKYWPLATATMVQYKDMIVSADDTLKAYLAEKEIEELPETETELAKKLAASSLATRPQSDHTIHLVQILEHEDRKGSIWFKTSWSNGDEIFKPRTHFKEEDEKEVLKNYVAAHPDARRKYNKKNREFAGSSTRPEAFKRAHVASTDSDDSSGLNEMEPRRKRKYTIRMKKNIGRLRKNAGLKRPVGRPRKNALPLMRRASRLSATIIIQNFFKSSSGEYMATVEDENGDFQVRRTDDLHEEEPELVYEALKKAAIKK